MMFTRALNRTNNYQISCDCRIESGSGVNSRKIVSRSQTAIYARLVERRDRGS